MSSIAIEITKILFVKMVVYKNHPWFELTKNRKLSVSEQRGEGARNFEQLLISRGATVQKNEELICLSDKRPMLAETVHYESDRPYVLV